MKTRANLCIATLPRSGVWGADDCGEPNSFVTASDKRQEKLPQQFSEPTSDFLVWGRSPCAVASRQTKRGYPRQRESEIALRRDSNRSGIFRQEKICDEGVASVSEAHPKRSAEHSLELASSKQHQTTVRPRPAGRQPV